MFDALMESAAEDAPITTVIAQRIRTLREGARLSGAGLAAEMVKLGVPWNRTTVAKLETGRRESVTVQELLALAAALNVPPVWLLTDPAAGQVVPIANGMQLDPWAALLWFIGKVPLHGDRNVGEWSGASQAIRQATNVAEIVAQLESFHRYREINEVIVPSDPVADDETERKMLRALQKPLEALQGRGYRAPAIPAGVSARAKELGVDLPGIED